MKSTTLLLTVILGVCTGDQSADVSQFEEPITSQLSQRETPEVVLQIKYDGGELNKIYLAQFRKGPQEWIPSVASRSTLCSDLCYGGLGGHSCGATCSDLVPVGLKSALQESHHHHDSDSYNITNYNSSSEVENAIGEPRTSVCPTLCKNGLGEPLCSCDATQVQIVDHVNWGDICNAFCQADRYVLGGCPACDLSHPALIEGRASRMLTSADGWTAWCNVQCRQGQGGAACNCNRSPFQ